MDLTKYALGYDWLAVTWNVVFLLNAGIWVLKFLVVAIRQLGK